MDIVINTTDLAKGNPRCKTIKSAVEFYEQELDLVCEPYSLTLWLEHPVYIWSAQYDFPLRGLATKFTETDPPTYEIRLAMQTYDDPRLTLAHEMIHIKQFVKDELKWFEKSVKWQNESYARTDPIVTDYNRRPWEREAYEWEYHYYHKYMRRQRLIKGFVENESRTR